MLEPIEDYYVVHVERIYEDTKTKAGIILLNAAYIDDGDMDRNEHKRLYGVVRSVPKVFSDRGYRVIDGGMPPYRKFIGHDDIVDRINRGYRNHAEKSYYPSTVDKYEVVTYADIASQMDVVVGDTIYFDPKVTEPENKIEGMSYKLLPDSIFCAVRDGKIVMQGEWVLVKPNMETWEEITTKSGIIMKPQPDRKWLEGVVSHTRHDHLHPGDKIVYIPNADCEVMVEGEKYYVMPVQDILGKLTD